MPPEYLTKKGYRKLEEELKVASAEERLIVWTSIFPKPSAQAPVETSNRKAHRATAQLRVVTCSIR